MKIIQRAVENTIPKLYSEITNYLISSRARESVLSIGTQVIPMGWYPDKDFGDQSLTIDLFSSKWVAYL